MKLKNVKVGETYIIKSLDHTIVGYAPFKVGDVVEVSDITGASSHTVSVYGGWVISHKDLKRVDVEQPPIVYTNPLQEHLGKEVEVVEKHDGVAVGVCGWVMSTSEIMYGNRLLIDFGDGFDGHDGNGAATHQQKTKTCWFLDVDKLKFLTEDEE